MNVDKKDHFIDIAGEVCPFTFVKTKILLDKVERGSTVRVRLSGAESIKNVPASVRSEGHLILSCHPENTGDPYGPHILTIEKQ